LWFHGDSFPVGDDPWGIDVSADGEKVVVACEDDRSLWVIDTTDWSTWSRTFQVSSPRDVDIYDLTNEALIASGDYLCHLDLNSYSTYCVPGYCSNINVVAVEPQISSVGTGIEEQEQQPLPARIVCFPNPLRSETTVRFGVPDHSDVAVRVYDVRGRLVSILSDGPREPGAHNVVWDGTNSAGQRVAAGVYFVKVSIDEDEQTGKLLLVK
jgi:DNA-binding beta-propeller fold protein YncE